MKHNNTPAVCSSPSNRLEVLEALLCARDAFDRPVPTVFIECRTGLSPTLVLLALTQLQRDGFVVIEHDGDHESYRVLRRKDGT